MPILRKEPDCFPEDVLQTVDGAPWWVAHVKSRQEKVLARYLRRHGIGFFLPQAQREVMTGGRRRRSYSPLLPGYVFFRAERAALPTVWRGNVLANLIDVEDQQLLHSELAQIHLLAASGASFAPYEDLVPGDAVQVREGPFKGYRGIVVRQKNSERLVVMVSLIRKAIAVEFGREMLAVT